MHRTKSQFESKSKTKVNDESSTSSSDQATVYAHQEHAKPRAKVDHILSPSTSDTSISISKQSLTSSISRFRSDFDELKCKMKIFGESLNLCRCIAKDFNVKLSNMEKRLEQLEKRQVVFRNQSNYSAIIQKNKKLSHKTQADAKRLQMCKTEDERREVAARICRNYLHGAWKTVDPQSLSFGRISGGLSNFIYYIALPDNRQDKQVQDSSPNTELDGLSLTFGHVQRSISFLGVEEPKNVLLRIYGQVHGERAMDSIVTESVIFTLLSERRLGPKLHGVFSGGRIEEFIPARSLVTRELSMPALSLKIAEKMAAIHSMNVPLSKEPTWLWKSFGKWIKIVKEERLSGTYQPKNSEEKRIIKELLIVDFVNEVEWLKKYVEKYASVVVFCHNDLQEGNILILEETHMQTETTAIVGEKTSLSVNKCFPNVQTYDEDRELSSDECNICDSLVINSSEAGEPRLFLIDFEYCAYNYRGFDLANHFQEWRFDYTNPDYPFYHELEENCPTLEQKVSFISPFFYILANCVCAYNYRGFDPEKSLVRVAV